jgi:ATP-dependent DNA helicase DinG
MEWRPHFPLKEPRPDQARALDKICADAQAGQRIFLAELGTGVGKSAVGYTFARWLASIEKPADPFKPGAVVLTSQKILQDQYEKDLGAEDLRAASNFECDHPHMGPDCGATSRIRKALMRKEGTTYDPRYMCKECPYSIAKECFAKSPFGVTNYAYFLNEQVYAKKLPLRHLLILDEAHNIEDEVRRWASVSITEKNAFDLGLELPKWSSSTAQLIEWMGGPFKQAILDRIDKLTDEISEIFGKVGQKAMEARSKENDRLDKHLCQINRILDKGEEILTKHDNDRISFQPLYVSDLANDILYSKAQRVLLMSATILDRKVFSRSAGLPKDATFISIPTPFKHQAFGVTYCPVGWMNKDSLQGSLPTMIKAIRRILKKHPNEKGIIHTVNYTIAKAIMDGIKDKRLLIQRDATDRTGIIDKHLKSKEPTVIVSPGMTEGLDLRDELGRFQIICKIPFPNLADPVIKAKLNVDRDWYNWRTIRTLAQAVGRGVRSETDFTKTYILDACFYDILQRNSNMFPAHLREDTIEFEEP